MKIVEESQTHKLTGLTRIREGETHMFFLEYFTTIVLLLLFNS